MVIKQLLITIICAIMISIVLILLGVLISYVIIGDKSKIDLTLFILGGIPIIFFLPGIFSKSESGALHTPKVFFRKVGTVEPERISDQNTNAQIAKFLSPAAIVLAGVITWLVGSVL